MKIPHIEIKQEGVLTNVFIDGQKITGLRKISFQHESGNSAPVVQMEFLATDMSIDASVIPELPEIFKGFYKQIGFEEKESERRCLKNRSRQ